MTRDMTETPRATSLPPSSDSEPYVPLSWLGVGSFSSAVVLVLVLIGLAYHAFNRKRPLLEMDLILIFAAVVMLLSFIGRRRIRNSEGTLSGTLTGKSVSIDLCDAAWWTALVVGL